MTGDVLGLDWSLALLLADAHGVDKATAVDLLPEIELGLLTKLPPPGQVG